MGRTQVREELTEFQPGRLLAYVLEGPAGPFASASSRWSTTVASKGATAVTVEGTFEPTNAAVRVLVWPLARPTLRRLTRRILGELDMFMAGQPTATV